MLVGIFPHSDRMRENTDQNNSNYEYFKRLVKKLEGKVSGISFNLQTCSLKYVENFSRNKYLNMIH